MHDVLFLAFGVILFYMASKIGCNMMRLKTLLVKKEVFVIGVVLGFAVSVSGHDVE